MSAYEKALTARCEGFFVYRWCIASGKLSNGVLRLADYVLNRADQILQKISALLFDGVNAVVTVVRGIVVNNPIVWHLNDRQHVVGFCSPCIQQIHQVSPGSRQGRRWLKRCRDSVVVYSEIG